MKDNDCYAFPCHFGGQAKPSNGMTLRDYFAAVALQGLLAGEVQATMDTFVKYSYEIADSMLKARG